MGRIGGLVRTGWQGIGGTEYEGQNRIARKEKLEYIDQNKRARCQNEER